MSLSQRGRRDLRIFVIVTLSSAVASALFGAFGGPFGPSKVISAMIGVVNSLLIATPIMLFELRGERTGVMRRLRRLPLAAYFAVKVSFYLVVIVAGIVLARALTLPLISGPFDLWAILRSSFGFAVAMAVAGNLFFEIGGLLGFGTLRNLLTGRYVQPRREQRAFLLVDMKNSTGMAERLGPVRFHELLNDFFRDVADAALECDAEIHKYVGDEAILTWPDANATADNQCLACPFLARDVIVANGDTYRRRYGVVPEFRAALHRGEIVAGEIGDVRREIAYVGDTLNVAARLLDAAKESGHDVLVSADLLERTELPQGLEAEPLPVLAVRGRAAPLAIAALRKSGASIARS
jgi:adenylate cyclase